MGTGGSFPGTKRRPGREADHSPPSSAEVDNEYELYSFSFSFLLYAKLRTDAFDVNKISLTWLRLPIEWQGNTVWYKTCGYVRNIGTANHVFELPCSPVSPLTCSSEWRVRITGVTLTCRKGQVGTPGRQAGNIYLLLCVTCARHVLLLSALQFIFY
jgi:hypothetical protein